MHNVHIPYSFNFAILSKKELLFTEYSQTERKVCGLFGGKIHNAKFVARD